MTISIFMDCGAPSLYNKLSRENKRNVQIGTHIKYRGRDDFSYTETEEYKTYRQNFADFLKEHRDFINIYPNLDVINNAELTYKNQKWMEKQGLMPMPVWHFGSDVKWLEKYINAGYEYICIGGMVPNPIAVLKPALDSLWIKHLTDKDGMPVIKVHGFAMTSFDLMFRYPWYSVDSKSWIDYARFGFILVPPLKNGKYDYFNPWKVAISNRSAGIRKEEHHIRTMETAKRLHVLNYLKEMGVPFGSGKIKKVDNDYQLKEDEQWTVKPADGKKGQVETILAFGVTNHHRMRMDINLLFYRAVEKAIPKWPWSIKRTINKGPDQFFQ